MTLFSSTIFAIVIAYIQTQAENTEVNTLKLLHVIFRHGDRNLDLGQGWFNPNVTSTYTDGDLTNKGKENIYLLGTWLQDRYGKFLGTYSCDLVETASTYYERSQKSLQLLLQGLFLPNTTKGSSLVQRKFKYNSLPINNTILVVPSLECKNYITLYINQMNSEIYHNALKKYVALNDYLKTNANIRISTLTDVLMLSESVVMKKELGVNLPHWTETILPLLENSVVDFFYISTATKELKQLLMGGFIKNIIENSQLKFADRLEPKNRKLFVYSGHDINVFCTLQLFGYLLKERPPYSSCVMIEAHTIDNVDGFKVFYKSGKSNEVELIPIIGCGFFCPLTKFIELYEDIFPIFDTC